ncbi:MAG: hypothetical protein HRT90_04505 [Candidatus Margulisbacteria bacterium]|nr:hypothetical protein [Candidatus Margulisiibacteriota bacterium]
MQYKFFWFVFFSLILFFLAINTGTILAHLTSEKIDLRAFDLGEVLA